MALQNKKAELLIRDLKEKLSIRKYATIKDIDSQSFLLSWSPVTAADEPNILVIIEARADDIQRTDALGLAQRVYNPQVAKLLLEGDSNAPGQAAEGANYAARAEQSSRLVCLHYELSKMGLRVETWIADPTVAPISDASWATATKLSEIGDLLNPAIGEV